MRAVIQRCNYCKVFSEGKEVGNINKGLIVLIGVQRGDSEKDASYIADKIVNLRIFEDESGKMNHSVYTVKGELALISQFTLYGDCRHGRRPGFTEAETPEAANLLYEKVVMLCKKTGIHVVTGRFQTHMNIILDNDGPVTLLIDSSKSF